GPGKRGIRHSASSISLPPGILSLFGHRALAEGPFLYVQHVEGLVEILPSMEKIGLRPLLGFATCGGLALAVLGGGRLGRSLIKLFALLAMFLILRYAFLTLIYLDQSEIVTRSHPSRLAPFMSKAVNLWWLVTFGVIAGVVLRDAFRPSASRDLPAAGQLSLRLTLGAAMAFLTT